MSPYPDHRRYLVIGGRSAEGPFTIRFADLRDRGASSDATVRQVAPAIVGDVYEQICQSVVPRGLWPVWVVVRKDASLCKWRRRNLSSCLYVRRLGGSHPGRSRRSRSCEKPIQRSCSCSARSSQRPYVRQCILGGLPGKGSTMLGPPPSSIRVFRTRRMRHAKPGPFAYSLATRRPQH